MKRALSSVVTYAIAVITAIVYYAILVLSLYPLYQPCSPKVEKQQLKYEVHVSIVP